jgi:phage antirepressor YoqD-like protein
VFNALADEQQKVRDLTEDNARMLPKAVAYDAIIDTDGTTTITKVARYLAQIDPRMTVKRLYALLRADELICKADRTPTKLAIKRGIAKQIMSTRNDGKANEPYARLTQKGIDFCASHYVTIPAQMKTV